MRKQLSFKETDKILFNLDSMRTHLQVLQDEDPDKEGLQEQIDEIENLSFKLFYRGLNKEELARVREIVAAREFIRYKTCIENGMCERDANNNW